jgi:hypothetical protein
VSKSRVVPLSVIVCCVFMCALALAADQKSPTKLSDLPAEAQQAISAALARKAIGGQHFTLKASDAENGDGFGFSVAIDGDTVVVGALGANAAYVFVKPASGWTNMTETAELTASDFQGEQFGYSVAISGNTIVVGGGEANVGGDETQGAAYVFIEPVGGWTNMTETAELTASDGVTYSGFGSAVAISGSAIFVGAPFGTNGNLGPGIVYEFTEPSSGWANMTQTAELTASEGAEYDDFGLSVSASGGGLLVGSPGLRPSGSAYIFVEPAGGWEDMTETATLTPSDATPQDGFGGSVSISGDTAVVGAGGYGAVYVFVQPSEGWVNMTQTAELTTGAVPVNGFGYAVAIDMGVILAGNPNLNHSNGRAFVFLEPPNGWQNASTYEANLGFLFSYHDNEFGEALAVSGTTGVIGAAYSPTSPPCRYICQPGPGKAFIFTEK